MILWSGASTPVQVWHDCSKVELFTLDIHSVVCLWIWWQFPPCLKKVSWVCCCTPETCSPEFAALYTSFDAVRISFTDSESVPLTVEDDDVRECLENSRSISRDSSVTTFLLRDALISMLAIFSIYGIFKSSVQRHASCNVRRYVCRPLCCWTPKPAVKKPNYNVWWVMMMIICKVCQRRFVVRRRVTHCADFNTIEWDTRI